MKIGLVKQSDQKAISELYYKLYPNHKGQKVLLPILKFTAKNLLFVANENDEIVGFVWGVFINYGISKYGYIEELIVKEEFRRKKIGIQLVNTLLEEFKKLNTWSVFVSTEKNNKGVSSFYNKLDFKLSDGLWLYRELI